MKKPLNSISKSIAVRLLRKFALLIILILIFNKSSLAQDDNFGLHMPGFKEVSRCNECRDRVNRLPLEVHYGVINIEGVLYFTINDPAYFELMFSSSKDGLAVDIVPKDRYACGKRVPKPKDGWKKGVLLEPIYKKEILKSAYLDKRENVYVKLGKLPENMKEDEVEYNVVFLNKKVICHYNTFYDIPSHRWDLLEMGLFNEVQRKQRYKKDSVTFYKTMKFVIPFEKNKYEYKEEDILPLYDSLRLTDFDIKKIYISAYSSVEGSYENNVRLQEERANSIVRVMEKLQGNSIPTDVRASENWIEFAEDIRDTKFKFLLNLSKAEIKERLKEEALSNNLEPYLAKHRKAVLSLDLDKKNTYAEVDGTRLVSMFQEQIEKENIEEAKEIQEALMFLIQDYKDPKELLSKMDIPNKIEYLDLLSNHEAFKFYRTDNIFEAISNFERLDKLFPENKQIKYNLVVLKIKAWSYGDLIIETDVLWNEILGLEKYGVEEALLNRLKINYKIIECEYLMRERKYEEKNKAIRLIYNMYRKIELEEPDLLNLAKFFVGYSRYDWATNLLEPRAKNIEAGEDLLFYYLNLTIINPNIIRKGFYQTILHNATNKNKERFCEIFDTYGFGGVTFQLLENAKLRNQYCEECNK